MKNGRKIKRSMWVAMAACAMIFLCIGGCLVYGLHAAEDYIDANCRRDLGALMEQLERPYITRLNTSAFLARAMERYLFSEGERTVDLQGEARFLSALDGQSVLDILFVTQDGQYISLSGKTGQQTIDTATRRKLAEGKMVSGYRMWNGEEAFFVVESLRPFAVHDVYYDAIALAYTPGTINGVLSFYAYGGGGKILGGGPVGAGGFSCGPRWGPAGQALWLGWRGGKRASCGGGGKERGGGGGHNNARGAGVLARPLA